MKGCKFKKRLKGGVFFSVKDKRKGDLAVACRILLQLAHVISWLLKLLKA